MKKLRKRVISMLLVVVLAVSLLPAGAFAADPPIIYDGEEYTTHDGPNAIDGTDLQYEYYVKVEFVDGDIQNIYTMVITVKPDGNTGITSLPDYNEISDRNGQVLPKQCRIFI